MEPRLLEATGERRRHFADTIAAEFQKQWEKLNIRVDRTIRTTDPRHHKKVQWLFDRCVANGYIYKGSYRDSTVSTMSSTSMKPSRAITVRNAAD